MLDPEQCYRALRARDARFDGRFFVGVITTGIYCRPVCTAGTAKFSNCRFYVSAAAAQADGLRPCLRCRPETAPAVGAWRGTSNSVSRAMTLIAEGALDNDDVDGLAARLGIGARQLRRLFDQHLGASPVAVAQTRRVLFAKQLIHDTSMSMADIALASGFGSVRRFNETFQQLYQRPPSALRKKRALGSNAAVTFRLRYRPPYDWEAMLAHLRARAIAGVEAVDADVYRRNVVHDGEHGSVEVRHEPQAQSLCATIRFPSVRALPSLVVALRRVFDVDADAGLISEQLAQDPKLAKLIAARPGLRVPGAWDGFELGVRAILGQQVSLAAGRALTERLVERHGTAVEGSLTRLFPCASQIVAADLSALPIPKARQAALKAFAEAVVADAHLFERLDSVEETVAKLCEIRGIGEWTAHYIALRAAREPDAFPASDAALLRSMGGVSAKQLLHRADRWRPWRGYAAQHLWTSLAAKPLT